MRSRLPTPALPAALPLALSVLLAACATPQPPKGAATARTQPPPKAQPAEPRWRAVPARADGVAVPGGRRHIVKRGETGIAIANAYRVPWNRIAAANRIPPDAVLQVGQPLFIPTGPPPQQAGRSRPRPAQPEGTFALDMDEVIAGSTPAGESPAPRPRPVTPPTVAQPAAAVPALAWPVDGRVILSRYGAKPGGRFNDGVNIKALEGGAVRAAADGEVIYVGDAIAGFGLMMLVRHAGGIVTAYAHLEDALAARGDRVQRGQPIARAGRSGNATEPQLHFQLRQGRQTLDPLLYLPR